MCADSHDSTSGGARLRGLLDRLSEQADEIIADFKSQDPVMIELAGQVDYLPGKVIDALIEMKDLLNVDARTAIENWEDSVKQGHREMRAMDDAQGTYHRAMLDSRESSLERQMREWQAPQAELQQRMWESQESPLMRGLREWQEREAERNRLMWEQLERSALLFRESLPPNWNSPEIEFPTFEQLEVLQLQEGMPLAWVPPNHVLSGILAVKTSASRRRVIARESTAILSACLGELGRLDSEETGEWRSAARHAALAMKAGHWRSGQALAANALDSATFKFVRSSFPDAVMQSRKVEGEKEKVPAPPGSSERSLPTWLEVDYPRALLVLHSIYGAFREFDRTNDDPVPTHFTRHATAHTVSQRQYSKANALIALMHVVGLLCLIEDE